MHDPKGRIFENGEIWGNFGGVVETARGEGERKLQWQVARPMKMCCAKDGVRSACCG